MVVRHRRILELRQAMASALSALLFFLSGFVVHLPGVEKVSESKEPSASKEERLKERDRYKQEMRKLRKEGKIQEAIEACGKMLAIERDVFGNLHVDLVASLQQLAQMHEELGDFVAAEKDFREVLSIREKVRAEEHWRVTDARLDLEDLERRRQMTAEERAELKKADRLDDGVSKLWEDGKSKEGIPLAEKAREIRERILGEEHRDSALSLFNLAVQYVAVGEYARAETLHRRALEIRKKVLGEEHPDSAMSMNHLGLLYNDMSDYTRAESLYRQAIEVRKKVLGEWTYDYAISIHNLALLYSNMADYARAEPLYLQALEIKKKAIGEANPAYANSLLSLAKLYMDTGDSARSEPLFRQAAEIYKTTLGEGHPQYAESLNHLAGLYYEMADYSRAGQLYRMALEIFKDAFGERHPHYAATLNCLAVLYVGMADFARAEPLYRRALEILKDTIGERHPQYAICLQNLAALYKAMGDFPRAEIYYRLALDIYKKTVGQGHPESATSLHNLALLYNEMGDYDRAEPLLRQALDIRKKTVGEEHPDCVNSLHHLAHLFQNKGDFTQAELLLGRTVEVAGKNLEALFSVQSERQQLSAVRGCRFYLSCYLALMSQQKGSSPEESYRQAMRWKGAVFSRQSRLRLIRSEPELTPLFNDLETTSSRLGGLVFSKPDPAKTEARNRQIAELTEQKEEIERKLSSRSAGFRRTKEMERLSPRDLQTALPERAALVDLFEYGLHKQSKWERSLLAFVLRREGPVLQIDLGPLEPIQRAIGAWREAIPSGAGLEKEAEAGGILRKALWEPFEKHLGDSQIVLVSPDGSLGRFPFSALPGSKPGTYLVEELSIALLPVPQLLPELLADRKPLPSLPSLLLVGGVDFEAGASSLEVAVAQGAEHATSKEALGLRGEVREAPRGGALVNFQSLASTEDEIRMVADTFEATSRGAKVSTLRGKDAAEAAIRGAAPEHEFIHLATHGFFAPEELKNALAPSKAEDLGGLQSSLGPEANIVGWHPGLLSGIVLAGANGKPSPDRDDGILTALELATLDLTRTELLVLSACDTGLGATAGGEGLLGLQRAAQVAGARTVIASLWKVGDAETQALMARFYQNLWAKRLPKLEALREAQLSCLRAELDRGSGLVTRGGGRIMPRQGGEPSRVPPRAWAAWVLSGDWR